MSNRSRKILIFGLAGAALVVLVAGVAAYLRGWGEDAVPRPGSRKYQQVVSAFYIGVAALDVDAKERAEQSLTKAADLVPREPATWANRGLLKIRLDAFDAAATDLQKAKSLAPKSAEVEELLGLLESRRGRFAEAIAHLQEAAALDPKNLRARYALTQEIERQGGAGSEVDARKIIEELLAQEPDNLALRIERIRLAAKGNDFGAVAEDVALLAKSAADWPPIAVRQLDLLKEATAERNARILGSRAQFLKNSLRPSARYRRDLAAVEVPASQVGEPIRRFLVLASPNPTPAPPDTAIRFTIETVHTPGTATWNTAVAISLTGEGRPALFFANARNVQRFGDVRTTLPFPGGRPATPPTPDGILGVDWKFDFRTDLVFAGAGGVRFFAQKEDGTFEDLTSTTKLGDSVTKAIAVGAWAADIEMDGDLDVVIGLREGPPIVVRNNGDGTFQEMKPFEGLAELRCFIWADLDNDGDPDAATLDARGVLRVFSNERAGRFKIRAMPKEVGALTSMAVAELNGDAVFDLVGLRPDGSIIRVSDRDEGTAWTIAEIARAEGELGKTPRIFAADFDNNGGIDLLVSGSKTSKVYLSDVSGAFTASEATAPFPTTSVADLYGDGRIDVVGLIVGGSGQVSTGAGQGAKPYHWQVIRPRAKQTFGDGRINSFAIGGEVEVRAGLLALKQQIMGPTVHFGLGEHPNSDVARILWPNGVVQAEFDAKADQVLVAEQRLKGSCPFVFAYNGRKMEFVTDFLWRSPLGLRINAQDTAGTSQTEDWVKIRGDQLAARDGYYDVRITADLWETHFFDHVALLAVDHPKGTEVFVDERFARTPPVLAVKATGSLLPLGSARDDLGNDVKEPVGKRDGRYVDTFGRGYYQGVTRDHWIELTLDETTPVDRPSWLVAQGWIHPTDSSLNVALAQGGRESPKGLSLEAATADGGWETVQPDLGFPAGKNKTILIDLKGVFRPGAPKKLRLRTNLEIFWDAIAVAEARDDGAVQATRLAPETAELRYRGFSTMARANESSPELPRYEPTAGASQQWRDLIGFHTRFGPVGELLERVDDRYVIMNAGDEMVLRFTAPKPPPNGWMRDFVLIGDGWEKDGDYNTAFSKTVLPLPSHDQPAYDAPPGALEDDPVYRRHPRDWENYHTRYVTPRDFQSGLRPR
jgi:tetratricopeptide (TPR) repeat protein